ncbi:MAG: hypothetical protein GC171_12445 [Terrimonas sp.]|nr:hypothetical protein [Terrimonas sp.]
MERKKPDVDIIRDILQLALSVYPASSFIKSLSLQYEERGGLSKKQLQGLYDKSLKSGNIPPAKLATLEAVIKKKPNRYKSERPSHSPLYAKDEKTGEMIGAVLAKYPEHKRVLFLKAKYDNNEVMTAMEKNDLERFYRLLK